MLLQSITLSAILQLLVFSCVSAQEYAHSWKDINYVGDTMTSHRMDIYLPKTDQALHPVILLIYGSAWFSNDQKEQAFNSLGAPLLSKGFAVAAINHRSSQEALFPAQLQDAKAALRFLRGRAEEYQLDTTFIGVTGYSSGGHLSALLGTTVGLFHHSIQEVSMDLEGLLGDYTDKSSKVHAVVDWYGPTNFLEMDSCGSDMVHAEPDSPESSLLGGPIMSLKEKVALANPITYIDPNDPPFLILHGDEDGLVPHCQSEMLYEALQKHRVDSELIIVPGGKHGPGVLEEKYFNAMTDFFAQANSQQY